MNSWKNWQQLNDMQIKPGNDEQGVYAIRVSRKPDDWSSDIIYIGESLRLRNRLDNLRRALQRLVDGEEFNAAELHVAAPKIKDRIFDKMDFPLKDIEISWIITLQNPDGVEKALLLAFYVSTHSLPLLNENF